jgi:hypothetical protein
LLAASLGVSHRVPLAGWQGLWALDFKLFETYQLFGRQVVWNLSRQDPPWILAVNNVI